MALFYALTVVGTAIIVDFYRRLPAHETLTAGALGLFLSGLLGNGTDRVLKQTVTDFVHVYAGHPSIKPWFREHLGTHVWPSFNVADAALLIAVFVFLAGFVGQPDREDDLLA